MRSAVRTVLSYQSERAPAASRVLRNTPQARALAVLVRLPAGSCGRRAHPPAAIRRVQEWMGHADIQTTMKYLHYESRKEDADLVARAFRTEQVGDAPQA